MPSIYDNVYMRTGLDVSGINPNFQDIRTQQQFQNQQFGQLNPVSQQGFQPSTLTGIDPISLAKILRTSQGTSNQGTSNLGARIDMALNSQASPYLQDQVSQLGSSTLNPFSNYNMGTGGFGNYGE